MKLQHKKILPIWVHLSILSHFSMHGALSTHTNKLHSVWIKLFCAFKMTNKNSNPDVTGELACFFLSGKTHHNDFGGETTQEEDDAQDPSGSVAAGSAFLCLLILCRFVPGGSGGRRWVRNSPLRIGSRRGKSRFDAIYFR